MWIGLRSPTLNQKQCFMKYLFKFGLIRFQQEPFLVGSKYILETSAREKVMFLISSKKGGLE
jgi:hypothetical protein